MFRDRGDIKLTGKHAHYMKLLSTPRNDEDYKWRLFDRYIDVYMIGAVVGFIQNRTEKEDNSDEYKHASSSIFPDVIIRENNNLTLIYQTIMLLAGRDKLSEDRRIDRAFKDIYLIEKSEENKKNLDLFNSYVRGGISYLYETIYKGTLTLDERIENIKDLVDEFHNDFYNKLYLEEIDYDKDRVY